MEAIEDEHQYLCQVLQQIQNGSQAHKEAVAGSNHNEQQAFCATCKVYVPVSSQAYAQSRQQRKAINNGA